MLGITDQLVTMAIMEPNDLPVEAVLGVRMMTITLLRPEATP